MLGNLQQFHPPEHGTITLCEVEGRIHSMPCENANVTAFTNTTNKHPIVHITRDLLHPNKLMEEGRDLLLPVETTFLKLLTQIYWEQGLREAVETASAHNQLFISSTARLLLKLMDKVNNFKVLLNPTATKSTDCLIEEYVQIKNWHSSPIRAIAWHYNITKIAVAASDDVVRIYGCENNLIPILKCKQQKNITCLAWRPMSNSDIAVGCESGVIIWNVDPNSMVTRPSMNHALILHRIEHRPVISISWSPRGDVLASVAASDSKILLWDPEMDRTSSLKRPGTMGHNLLKWSPAGDKLFAATSMYVFRVWNCVSWNADRWSVLNGRVQACCWSPDGRHLLFSTNEEPIIYLLSFGRTDIMLNSPHGTSANEAVPLFDVTKVDLDGFLTGGRVRCMDWDRRGNHLAVLFQDSNVVAMFYVIAEPVLQLTPGFLITGNPEETPNTIMFQHNFEHGACLSIGWSSGRLQHFPIVYSDKLLPNTSPKRNSNAAFALSTPSRYYSPG